MRHLLVICAAAGAGFAVNMVDLHLSWVAVATGHAYELNPFLASAMGSDPLLLMAMAFLFMHSIIWSLVFMISRDRPRLAAAISVGLAGVFTVVLLRDISMILSLL